MDLPLSALKSVAPESFPDAKTSTAYKAVGLLTTELKTPNVPPVTGSYS